MSSEAIEPSLARCPSCAATTMRRVDDAEEDIEIRIRHVEKWACDRCGLMVQAQGGAGHTRNEAKVGPRSDPRHQG
jgi:hypothetical protein